MYKKAILSLLLLPFCTLLFATGTRTTLSWQVGHSDKINEKPVKWIAAQVPGAVQLDVAKAEKYGPHFYAENWKDYLWMEDKFFTYKTTFNKPVLQDNQRLYFVSKGIDYEFDIYLNGEKILYQEGMFTPVRLDITNRLKDKNALEIVIYPVPKMHPVPADRSQAAQSVKPAVSYGWDWHPRLVPSGIWDETFLEVRNASHLTDVWVDYILNDGLTRSDIQVNIEGLNLKAQKVTWELKDQSGKVVARGDPNPESDKSTIYASLDKPQLWWPHDHGNPYLYTSTVTLSDASGKVLDTQTSKVGFRRVELVMSEGAWREPEGFPKGRSVAPIQLRINNRNIFCKGTNWVAPDIFPGRMDSLRYQEMLDRVKEVNFNMLRIWGGCIINKESFFNICDELGILVWQEFPLSCNNYLGTPQYLKVLEQESASIIRRVRKHASLAMWCGGNELFNSWSGMTDQSLALRLLNSQCLLLDPKTPYINTSPIYGMAHGHYVFRDMDNGEEVYSLMARARNTAYTEFGMPAPSSVDVLKSIIPEKELWPPKPGTSWESHHAFNAWVGNTWLMPEMLQDYFGPAPNLETLVAQGQLLQGEGYKAIYEGARRQKPYCTMALNWCFNEPWPTAANNSLINWPNIPKPAFYAVRDACRPFLASATIKKLKWREGEEFSADIWLLNDLPEKIATGKVVVKLKTEEKEILLLNWDFDAPEANKNVAGPTVRAVLPAWNADRFELFVEVECRPEYNSSYTMLYVPRPGTRKAGTAILNQ